VVSWRRPWIRPDACGSAGVRSPSRYGSIVTPEPGSTACRSMPSSSAVRSTARVQFSVHASGSQPALAAAKPATVPVGSAGRRPVTAYTVPEVPRLITGVPGRTPRPSAAAALSPVPGATSTPSASGSPARTVPAASPGRTTRGSRAGSRPMCSKVLVSYSSLAEAHQPVPEASPRSVVPSPVSRSVR
jgi:hypothetical protein